MRALLIGGNGFIGRFVAASFLSRGNDLAIFHRGNTGVPAGVTEIIGNRGELQARAHALKTFRPDVVIDFIISSGAQAGELMSVFRGVTGRVVMLSSMDVYRAIGIGNGTEDGPLQGLPLTEESELRRNLHPYTPESMRMLRKVFSWATDDYDKIPAERAVMNDSELPGTVLRLPMIYGPGDPLHRFYPVVKRISDRRRHLLFAEPLAAWRSPRGHIENVAAAVVLAATDSRAAGRIYNVCEEPAFSELEWAQKIAAEMQWDGEFVVLPTDRTPPHLLRPGNAAQHWTASSARIRRELGYVEPVAVDEAIRQTIRWELENPPALPLAQFDYEAEESAIRLANAHAPKPS
jgi:nucleoside-diphosphate-sugar epimerase